MSLFPSFSLSLSLPLYKSLSAFHQYLYVVDYQCPWNHSIKISSSVSLCCAWALILIFCRRRTFYSHLLQTHSPSSPYVALTLHSLPPPIFTPYRTDALSTQMTQRVKSSDMMLRKSFSRTLMSRSHLHSPAKDHHTTKDDNGIFIVISCFDWISEQFQVSCLTDLNWVVAE